MRLVRMFVPSGQREPVRGTLEDLRIDYAVTDDARGGRALFEFPIPAGAVNDVLSRLREEDIDVDDYTVVSSADAVISEHSESIEERYGDSYSPLPTYVLRGKARSMTQDMVAYVWLIFLSAVIAAAGLLADSPAIVVGSMVIAPIVGPVLGAGVGLVVGDREMLLQGFAKQGIGFVVAVVAAVIFGVAVQVLALVPPEQSLGALELVSVRMAPTATAMVVGVSAGAAAAFGLTTEGPLSIIGVMIAAALIPSAAGAGLSIAWGEPLLAVGMATLLLATLVAINAAVVVTLTLLGYSSPVGEIFSPGSLETRRLAGLALAAVVLAAAVGVAGVATYQHATYERNVNQAVGDVLSRPAYDTVEPLGVSAQYDYPPSLPGERTVTVTLSLPADADYPRLSERLVDRIRRVSEGTPKVRIEYAEYDTGDPANPSPPSLAPSPPAVAGPA